MLVEVAGEGADVGGQLVEGVEAFDPPDPFRGKKYENLPRRLTARDLCSPAEPRHVAARRTEPSATASA